MGAGGDEEMAEAGAADQEWADFAPQGAAASPSGQVSHGMSRPSDTALPGLNLGLIWQLHGASREMTACVTKP